MSNTENPGQEAPEKARFMPLWLAIPLALFVWGVLPWALSLLSRRYGWAGGLPGSWNLSGLIPLLAGLAGLFSGMVEHAAQSPKGIEWELDRSYLLKSGIYSHSRHPMYLAELVLMAGWVIFYGSLAVLTAMLGWFLLFSFYQIPLEERILEEGFGEAYREYKKSVRRWFGRIRS